MYKRHGFGKTRFYEVWSNMKQRCLNPKALKYKYYGGKGITVCNEWIEYFMNFYHDMYLSYFDHVKEFGEKNTTVDRIDNNKGYCKEKIKNRRSIKIIKMYE